MTRSQSADIACARNLIAYLPEAKTAVVELWAERFVTKERRDFLNAFLMEIEEAAARLTLRAGHVEKGQEEAA